MLILPAFFHARYYIRNSISVETCQTIVSAFVFSSDCWGLVQLYVNQLHVRKTWRNLTRVWPHGLKMIFLGHNIMQRQPSKPTKLTPIEKKILKHMLWFCPDLRDAGPEHKRTRAATEELGDGTRTFNYAPIFKLAHQHQSGSYLEELHDLRLCHPPWIKPFITCWHFCPVLNARTPWASDEASETWRVMDNPLLCKGWLAVSVLQWARGVGGSRAWLSGHANRFGWQMPSSQRRFPSLISVAPYCPPPTPEVADSSPKRNHPRQMGTLTLAGPSKHCVLVTCHLLLFCGWNNSRQSLSVWGETPKKKKKEKKKGGELT